jgi:hypothetical protein
VKSGGFMNGENDNPVIFEEKIKEALEGIGLEIYRIQTVRYSRFDKPSYKIIAHTQENPKPFAVSTATLIQESLQ